MIRGVSLMVAALAIGPACLHVLAESPAEQAAAARNRLTAWHGEKPESGERLLHIIAWRSSDRGFAENHRQRLDRMLTDIQSFYRRELQRHGLAPGTIRLDRDTTGQLVIHEVTGAGRWADYGRSDGSRIRAECLPVLRQKGIDINRETIMIFTNLASWDPLKGRFQHKSPFYAGGDWRRGIAWQLDSPELDTLNLPLLEPLIEDGEYGRISLGKHNSIFIGGIAHELGHALGLPHCRARRDEERQGTALMGSGNRTYGDERRNEGKGTFLTLAHALRLASHPQFTKSIKGIAVTPKGEFSDLSIVARNDGKSFTVQGRADCQPPVYVVIGYLDPEGGGDYDSRTVTAVPDREGRFELECNAVVPGRSASLRLVACHVNGSTTKRTFPYSVEPSGRVDVRAARALLALDPFLDRLHVAGPAAAKQQIPADEWAVRLAAAVLEGRSDRRKTIDPQATNPDVTSLPLSQAVPVTAQVGWRQPAYDNLPQRDALIEAAGQLYETGIYAHAPAVHAYAVGGKWRRLRGACGLPSRRGGSVVFVILSDGREVFRSPRLQPGRIVSYDVDLTDVTSLELRTENAGDGNNGDWGIWLAPMLSR